MATRDPNKWTSVILAPKTIGRYLVSDMHGNEFEADYVQSKSGSRHWSVPSNVSVMKWKQISQVSKIE